MLTVANGQLTQVQDSDIKQFLTSYTYCKVKQGAYKGGKIPMQELDSQRRERAYFWRDTVFVCL